jgi:TonB family protein
MVWAVSLSRPYWMSLLGHFTILFALMAFSTLQRPDMVVGGVNIVFPPPGSGSGGGAATVTPPPEPTPPAPAPEPEPEPAPQEEKKGEEKKHPQPEMNVVKEPDPAGVLPPKQGDIPSKRATERDAEKGGTPPAKSRETAAPAADTPGTPGSGTGPGGGGGIGVEGGVLGANAPWYLMQLRDKVASNWRPPASVGHPGEAKATFHFEVHADGTVAALEPLQGSDSSLFDRAAMRAILESSPLPPLPEDLGATTIGITLIFTQEY